MKKLVVLLGIALLCLAVAPSMASTDQSWTGWITDSHCGAKGAGEKHTQACATKCVKDGGTIQFVNDSDKKSYEIDKAHWDEAMTHVGHLVTVTGVLDKGAITVSKIEMPAPGK